MSGLENISEVCYANFGTKQTQSYTWQVILSDDIRLASLLKFYERGRKFLRKKTHLISVYKWFCADFYNVHFAIIG